MPPPAAARSLLLATHSPSGWSGKPTPSGWSSRSSGSARQTAGPPTSPPRSRRLSRTASLPPPPRSLVRHATLQPRCSQQRGVNADADDPRALAVSAHGCPVSGSAGSLGNFNNTSTSFTSVDLGRSTRCVLDPDDAVPRTCLSQPSQSHHADPAGCSAGRTSSAPCSACRGRRRRSTALGRRTSRRPSAAGRARPRCSGRPARQPTTASQPTSGRSCGPARTTPRPRAETRGSGLRRPLRSLAGSASPKVSRGPVLASPVATHPYIQLLIRPSVLSLCPVSQPGKLTVLAISNGKGPPRAHGRKSEFSGIQVISLISLVSFAELACCCAPQRKRGRRCSNLGPHGQALYRPRPDLVQHNNLGQYHFSGMDPAADCLTSGRHAAPAEPQHPSAAAAHPTRRVLISRAVRTVDTHRRGRSRLQPGRSRRLPRTRRAGFTTLCRARRLPSGPPYRRR